MRGSNICEKKENVAERKLLVYTFLNRIGLEDHAHPNSGPRVVPNFWRAAEVFAPARTPDATRIVCCRGVQRSADRAAGTESAQARSHCDQGIVHSRLASRR